MLSTSQLQKRTRQRGKNFSPLEEKMLVDLLQPYKDIIDNKRSDAVSCQLKKDAWEQLSHQFSIQTGMLRSWRTLKDKYKNMNNRNRYSSSIETEDLEPASSCVSVVYEQILGQESDLNIPFESEGDSTESPTIKSEPIQEETPMEITNVSPIESVSQPSPSPIRKKIQKRIITKRKRSLEDEKIQLVRCQQKFHFCENIRAAEKHRLELKSITLRNELLEIELEERRQRIRTDKANTTISDTSS